MTSTSTSTSSCLISTERPSLVDEGAARSKGRARAAGGPRPGNLGRKTSPRRGSAGAERGTRKSREAAPRGKLTSHLPAPGPRDHGENEGLALFSVRSTGSAEIGVEIR